MNELLAIRDGKPMPISMSTWRVRPRLIELTSLLGVAKQNWFTVFVERRAPEAIDPMNDLRLRSLFQ